VNVSKSPLYGGGEGDVTPGTGNMIVAKKQTYEGGGENLGSRDSSEQGSNLKRNLKCSASQKTTEWQETDMLYKLLEGGFQGRKHLGKA